MEPRSGAKGQKGRLDRHRRQFHPDRAQDCAGGRPSSRFPENSALGSFPNWTGAFHGWERFLFRRFPGYMRLFRTRLYLRQEVVGLGYTVKPKYMRLLEQYARRHLRKSVSDSGLREKLTPK